MVQSHLSLITGWLIRISDRTDVMEYKWLLG
jgi:hypothetical protein